jgi:hypothetical protein
VGIDKKSSSLDILISSTMQSYSKTLTIVVKKYMPEIEKNEVKC